MIKTYEEFSLNEMSSNDPILVALRAAKMVREKNKKEEAERRKKRVYGKKREDLEYDLSSIADDLKGLYQDKRGIYQDMEDEAGKKGDEWTDDDANHYGKRLNDIDDEIEKLITRRNQIEIKLAY